MKRTLLITLDDKRHDFTVGEKEIILAPKEFAIMAALKRADGKVLSRFQIVEAAWKEGRQPSDLRTVDQHVARLRRKIGITPSPIRTVSNVGYKFKV